MNNDLLLLLKKHTDTLIEQTKSRLQERLEYKVNKQTETFPFNPPIILIEEKTWLLSNTFFETTNSVFNITNENNSFSISIPFYWRIPNYLEDDIIDNLNDLLKITSENGIELHVNEVRKKGNKIKINSKENSLSDVNKSKKETLEELKKVEYHHLEDMVNRMQLSCDEIMDLLGIEYFPSKRTRYNLPVGVHELSDIDLMLKFLLLDDVKVNITIDNVRLKSNLKNNQTLIFTKRSFFYSLLGFTQSRSSPLSDIEGFVQTIPGTYERVT